MQVFTADSLTKVLREPEGDEGSLAPGPVRIRACRNERESFQVVVAADDRPLSGVSVEISDLQHESGGSAIPASQVVINPVAYVETHLPAYPVTRVGWWPDPLMPPGPARVEAGQRQPFWLTVHVPTGAAPGPYRGQVTVRGEGRPEVSVPVEVKVWDFSLAPAPPLPSAFGVYPHQIERFYGQHPVPEEVLRNYWDLLFSHRISSDKLGEPLKEGLRAVMEGRETRPFDFRTFDERLEYCFPRGLTSFLVARLPGFQDDGPDLTQEEQQRLVDYLGDFARHLEERGWLERAFTLVWDEPWQNRWPEVLKQLKTIHRAHPGLRTRLDGPVTGPLIEACESEIDVFVLHMRSVAEAGKEAQANIERWREAGRSLWIYVACDTNHPYPNIHIDYPLMDCRILPWVNWRYDIEGMLYWTANWWGEENLRGDAPEEKWPHRPWVCANFVEEGERGRREYNGDGHLIYPGPDGTALSSVRLEALRDGVEDHEYVWLLENGLRALEEDGKAGDLAAEAREWLAQQAIVDTYTEWCRDPAVLSSARDELADLIVRVQGAGGVCRPG